MLTTEDEAKGKRCFQSFPACAGISSGGHMVSTASPFAHGYSGGAGYALQTAPTMCIGSACMAWRWSEMIERTVIDGVERQMGYCGLAGRP